MTEIASGVQARSVEEISDFTRIARIIIALGFFLVMMIGSAAVTAFLRTAEATRLVAHTLEVQQAAGDLLSNVQDAETGQRGFLLTGEASYLEPFHRADIATPQILQNLTSLTSDNPTQQDRLRALKPVIEGKFDELRSTIALSQQGQRNSALEIVNSNRGKEMMDDIRARLNAFGQSEVEALAARNAGVDGLRRWVLGLILFSLSAALALAAFLGRSTQYYIDRLRERTTQLETEARHRFAAEETLRQVQKMEAVGQLTGGIAHDFNNLLTIIGGSLDTLRRRLTAPLPTQDAYQLAATLAKPVDLALQGTDKAAQLTHRLLAFSRRQTLEPTRLDLNRLVSNMSDMLRRTLGETINVEIVLAGGLWMTHADANQLENALINLAINARDAMPGGGRLTIETANIYLDDAYVRQFGDVPAGQYVLLSVSDTGKGIPRDILERVFEPFFTTKPAGQGSGLGLAMVHGFTKQSGGHVRIYSEVGHGTTVKIYLPRLAEGEAAAAPPTTRPVFSAPLPRAKAQECILLVEDNEGVREYAKGALEELGYRVLEASSAEEALRRLDANVHVDLLFTDVVLPGGMNGRELANAILELRGGLPVLFTTGYTRNAIVHGGRLDANVHLLGKPYTQKDLARKIREVLDQKSGA